MRTLLVSSRNLFMIRSRGTQRYPVPHVPAQKRCTACQYRPDYRDNPSRPTGGVAAPAVPPKARSRQKTGADAPGRPRRAWGVRLSAYSPPARLPPGAASARVKGGVWPNRQGASRCLSLRPEDAGSYPSGVASGKSLQVHNACRRGLGASQPTYHNRQSPGGEQNRPLSAHVTREALLPVPRA